MRTCRGAIVIIVILMMSQMNCTTTALLNQDHMDEISEAGRNSGIDVKPVSVSFNYPSSSDQDKYQMFSSNHPIANFNRGPDLFVIDGMIGINLMLTITIQNSGSNSSGVFPVSIVVEHDEYVKFDLLSDTVTSQNINPGSDTSLQYTWTPTYSGNHSLIITTQHSLDNNNGNDAFYRHITVGNVYYNCDDFNSWSVGSSWSANPDAAISKGVACHVGNGASSNYGNSITSTLSTPVWDFSDRHSNPTRAIGMTFFATGSAQSGDTISFQARKADGTWVQIGDIAGSIDPTVADGTSSWSTFTNTVGTQTLPLAPLTADYLHASSQFRYVFTSNSAGTDIGYWLDELVWYYDQRAGIHEYDWRIGANNQSSTQRGQWSDQLVTIHNDGNVSDRYIPSLNLIPSDWEYSILNQQGGNIDPNIGIQVLPGESHNLRIRLKPGLSAPVGTNQYQLHIASHTEASIIDTKILEIEVEPSYIPLIVEQEDPALCAPGNSCEFFIEVENIGEGTDDFSIGVSDLNVLSGWTLGLSWDQANTITISPNQSGFVKFVVSVPSDADPDLISSVWLEITSAADPSKTNTSIIRAKSAMVTVAEVGFDSETWGNLDWSLLPGEAKEITFTVWNNATRLDTFLIGVNKQGAKTWTLTQPTITSLAVNPSSSSTFTAIIQAPTTGQVGDPGPILSPWATSTLSGTNATSGLFDLISIKPVYDLNITIINGPSEISPGVATAYGIEIENNGNGPVDAVISVDGISSDWNWWMVVDELVVDNPISLSPSYELDDVKYIEIYLLIPQEIGPAEDISLEISVAPETGVDSNIQDNTVLFEIETTGVKITEIVGFNSSTQLIRVSESLVLDFEIHNVGNIADPYIKAKIQTQSLPQTDGVMVSLFNTQFPGDSVIEGEWISVPILASSNASMRIVIEIGEHVQVGTNIAISLLVEGGEDDNGNPITLTSQTAVEIYERRDVSVDFIMNKTAIIGHSEDLKIVAWSNSSVIENLVFTPNIPEGWSLQCNGISAASGYTFTILKSDGMRPTSTSVDCKLIDGGIEGTETLSWHVENAEGEIIANHTLEFTFDREVVEEDNFLSFALKDPKTIVVGIVSLTIITVISLLILARKRTDEDIDEVISGPPANIANVKQFTTDYSNVPAQQVPIQDPLITQSPYTELVGGYTVNQLLAAGWTEEQIEWKRREEVQSTSEPQPLNHIQDEGELSEEGDDSALGDAFAALGG